MKRPPDPSLTLYRALMLSGGATYLLWWKAVEILLPGSFNPFLSRLAVAACCWVACAATFVSAAAARRAGALLSGCLWLITAHYFYLFHHNRADINWVVGSYILIIAACACLQTEAAILGFSAWVLALSATLSVYDGLLARTTFLPGVVTILAFAFVGLRSRVRWLERSRETSRRFQNLFDSVFEGIVVHDRGVILDANEPFAAIFGYPLSEIKSMKVSELIEPGSRALAQARIDGMSEEPYELTGLRKDDTTVPIEVRGKAHVVRGKTLRLSTVSDLTARKRGERDRVLYEASRRALEIRDDFLAIASHELKTPLTNIKLQTQLALRELKQSADPAHGPARMLRLAEQTDLQADRLNHLVDEMLDVSRISSGKLRLDREEFDLAAVVTEVAASFATQAERAGVRVEVEASSPLPIRADRPRLAQVVASLLSNAIKYGDAKPVLIRLERSGGDIRLSVEDHGHGISAENREKIFERFERAAPMRKISGLGLGLFISKSIVDALGGRIEVASRPEHGALFTVVLPSGEEPREARA